MLRRISLTLALALTSGCVTDPDLSVLDMPDLAKSHVQSGKLETPPAGISPDKALTVQEAVRIALVNNPDIGQAIARVQQARANLRRARAPFLPSLDAKGGYTKHIETSPTARVSGIRRGNDIYSTGLDMNWNLFAGGRDWQNYAATRELRDSAAKETERVKNVVEHAVHSAFYQAILARESIDIRKASVAFSERELKDATARYEVGRGLKTDKLTFETRMLDAQVRVTEAENSLRLALLALGELMAMALPDGIELGMPSPEQTKWEKIHEEQTVQTAWQQRMDLAALRDDYAAARRQVDAAKAEFLPRLDATGAYEVEHRNSPDFSHHDDGLTAGLGVVWNLYNGGDTVAAIAAARRAAIEKAEGYRQLKLRIRTQVSNALTSIKNARRRVELGEKTVATAEETLKLLTDRYRAGAITISQVTEGELRLSQARLDLVQAKIDLLAAQSGLVLAVGGPQRQHAE